jgi:hypothetical protein
VGSRTAELGKKSKMRDEKQFDGRGYEKYVGMRKILDEGKAVIFPCYKVL